MKKKIIVLILSVLTVIAALSGCGGKGAEIDWNSLELGEYLPKPDNAYGEIYDDTKESLWISLTKATEADFKSYKKQCEKFGYTVDVEETGSTFTAFNAEGYKIDLSCFTDLSINLDAPQKFEDILWPTSGLGAMLPKPKSNVGKVVSDSSSSFSANIGNMSIEEYNEYVKACQGKGFNVDYNKYEDSYSAENAQGYSVKVRYEGANVIYVYISSPEKTSSTLSNVTETSKPAETKDEIRPDFKRAMDSYESFMNDYVAFMKRYAANPTDMGILADYSEYMSDYADMLADFEAWGDKELNNAELQYYLDVQNRVNKKITEIAY